MLENIDGMATIVDRSVGKAEGQVEAREDSQGEILK